MVVVTMVFFHFLSLDCCFRLPLYVEFKFSQARKDCLFPLVNFVVADGLALPVAALVVIMLLWLLSFVVIVLNFATYSQESKEPCKS